MNYLPLDNASLKLRHNGVRVLVGVSRIDMTSVVFVEPGAKVNGQYTHYTVVLMKRFWPRVTAKYPCKMWPLQVDAVARRRTPSHTVRSTV